MTSARPLFALGAAAAGVLACSSLTELADRRLDARAPASASRSWTPRPEVRASYALPEDVRAPRSVPSDTTAPPGGIYDLPALVDLALAQNPTTRAAWETARAAEAGLGRAKAEDYPQVRLSAYGGVNNF